MSKYNELIKGRIYIGGADGVEDVLTEKDIDLVIDLRSETNKSKNDNEKYETIHQPILDDMEKKMKM